MQEAQATTGHGKGHGEGGHGVWAGNLSGHAGRQAGAEDRTRVTASNGIIESAEDSIAGLREPEWWAKGR